MVKKFKVYGRDGHRQGVSFLKSYSFTDCDGFKYDVINSDKTGTNKYTIVCIDDSENKTSETIEDALDGQISDGIFENNCVGKVVEII